MKRSILILMSTYNGEKFLEAQLQSIFSQKEVEVFLLIRDDGSTDKTVDILESYYQKKNSKIINLIKGENIGFGGSFSYLVKSAYKYSLDNRQFDFYAFADQDDVWLEDKLQVAVTALNKCANNRPLLYCSNSTLADEELKEIGYYRNVFYNHTKENALVEGLANGCTMVYNFDALKLYAENVTSEIKVHDLYLYQITIFFGEVIYDKNSYILYRQHGENQIGKASIFKRWKRRIIKRERYEVRVIQLQCYYLLKSIKHLLPKQDIDLISKVAYYHKSFKNKISLIIDREIKYPTIKMNIYFSIKVILGIF